MAHTGVETSPLYSANKTSGELIVEAFDGFAPYEAFVLGDRRRV
ncbi:hypothetical protein CLV47_11879 [Antricoccus suffuscus]|uniref:Uncharacterized protein n=1 Tax=Antricoccus suffuscus TaxID=1629062 RepID=A0A2T0ZTQ5_9ACTN|nr:hypothetical protein CLV47_11879 [Antricoccus suffuscus]